jgi:translation initiation factor 2B subunit (eIF-2B alpha/beta/delta family)/ADP-ribose pyrophosphatase YjhB (NUDIX family)
MPDVVTCFLRHEEAVLLVRRADDAPTHAGLWAGVSGYVEGDPGRTRPDADREVEEETGITGDHLVEVRAGDPVTVGETDPDGDEREWTVHPYLFESDTREVEPNEELAATEWVQPTAMLDRPTGPGLWPVYRAVAPTVPDVTGDPTHGSAHLSVRALSVLRDAAGDAEHEGDDWATVAATARDLRSARPGMTALRTRVDRVVSEADRDPAAVRRRAETAVVDALGADERAADAAASELADLVPAAGDRLTVLTCSRSGTVAAALRRVEPTPELVVADSRPGGEGVGVAESFAGETDVTLVPDSAVAQMLAEPASVDASPVDVALVGADAVLPDASVVNKVGTRALGLAAAADAADVPLFVVTARDKVGDGDDLDLERADASAVYDGEYEVRVVAPLFDRTPAPLVTAVVTEAGPQSAAAVRDLAEAHAALADWLAAVEE